MRMKFKRLAVVFCLLTAISLMLFSCTGNGAAVTSSLSDSSSEDISGEDEALGGTTSDEISSEPDAPGSSSEELTSSATSSAKEAKPESSISSKSKDSSKAASKAASSNTSSKAKNSKSESSKATSSKAASSKVTSSKASSSKAASSKAGTSTSSKVTGGTEIDYGPRISDDPAQSKDTSFYSDIEDEIFDLLNELRVSQGLNELKKSSSLSAGARIRAKEMYDYNYFAHSRPDGGSWDSVFKVEIPLSGYSYLGENLAKTTGTSPSASYFMELWTNSPGHYENMVRDVYTHVGIGVYYGYVIGKGKVAYAVQEFGTFK